MILKNMSTLNNYFDKIYCINLDRRSDRWEKCEALFDKVKIQVERFSAIDKNSIVNNSKITNGQLACLYSHYNVVQTAKNFGYSKILILEDDVVFEENIDEIFKQSIDDIPEDWNMLYFGGNHLHGLNHVKNNVYKTIYSLATHAYGIKNSFYDTILSKLKLAELPVDVYYASMHQQYPSYLIKNGNSQLAWQDSGYSDIEECVCNYDYCLK